MRTFAARLADPMSPSSHGSAQLRSDKTSFFSRLGWPYHTTIKARLGSWQRSTTMRPLLKLAVFRRWRGA
jgi:hypothetical protein